MKVKKIICMFLATLMVLSLAACGSGSADNGKQTASAYLDQDGNAVVDVTVDLSGGWSVEFARGAAYLYDGEITEGKDSAAMLITLEKEVYEDHLKTGMADTNKKEADGGIYYTDDSDQGAFLIAVNDTAYVLITAADKKNIEAVVARFALSTEN